jgi:hypothetical protein
MWVHKWKHNQKNGWQELIKRSALTQIEIIFLLEALVKTPMIYIRDAATRYSFGY